MNVETLRILVAKGLSPEDILEVAETLDAPKPRSAAAIRQARYRAKQKGEEAGDVTGDVTRDANSDVTASLSLLPNENKSNPTTHTHEKQTPRARKGTRLPEGWMPEPFSGDLGRSVSIWPPGAIERELARFRDWAASASGPNAVKSDWQAAWRNWVRKAEDEGRYRNGKPQQHRGIERESTRETAMRLAARLEGASSSH